MMAHFKTIQNASKFKKLSKYLYLQCQQNLKVVNPQILQNIDRAKTLTLEYHHVLYLIPFKRLSVDWITLRVHGVGKNLALIFFIVTTSILVSK